jgi:BCD family chlorophyll transporter-like MFS transporter
MIVELGVPATLVALMIALPLMIAPLRALVGHRSDNYASYLGWRRVPFLFIGSMLQFGGLAILPFALILISGDTHWPMWFAQAATALAFLLVGLGVHMVQTAGLALATDIAPVQSRTRVVALLYVMLLMGMVASSMVFSWLLSDFTQVRLIQVLQGSALLILVFNLLAAWKQEVADRAQTHHDRHRPNFIASWSRYMSDRATRRFLLALALGTAAFSMQDVLLEPYGGEVLGLNISATTMLTAILVAGTLLGFGLAARSMSANVDPCRVAAYGVTLGLFAFAAVIFAAPLQSVAAFQCGTFLIGMSAGLFSISMLSMEMRRRDGSEQTGLALGMWGAVQACSAGLAIAVGGTLRDLVAHLAQRGDLGTTLNMNHTGYTVVYLIEIGLLFMTLIVIGPLVGRLQSKPIADSKEFGLEAFPG